MNKDNLGTGKCYSMHSSGIFSFAIETKEGEDTSNDERERESRDSNQQTATQIMLKFSINSKAN